MAVSSPKCVSANDNMAYFVFMVHALFGVVGCVLNTLSNLKKYQRSISKGLLFLELVMFAFLLVLWVVLYKDAASSSSHHSSACQRLFVIEQSYLVLQPVAVLLMALMAWLRQLQKRQESTSLGQHDLDQLRHVQMQEEDSYVS